ncbi:MAG: inositol monophosphatase family protein [Balneolaceae bacterium]
MNYQKELNTAREAAKEASKIIKGYRKDESFEIQLKRKNDLVTDADVASEKKIIEIIKSIFPTDQFLAEESNTYTELPKGRVWIIDPIDGTTNFSHGFPPYCVSIAFWVDGVAKVGLVLEVANDEWFWAVEGEGAYLGDQKLSISQITDHSKALIATGFPYSQFDLVDPYLQVLKTLMHKTHGIRRAGSAAYDLCCVASGRVDGFYEYGLSPWDIAAGILIIQEAGGISTDWEGGQNQLFGKRIISGNSTICKFLEGELKACFEEENLSL